MPSDPSPSQQNDRSLSPPPFKKRKYESTTTNEAVKSFFTPSSKKMHDRLTWRILQESVLVGNYQPTAKSQGSANEAGKKRKIAAFDLDSTLITTKTGKVFSSDAADWKWWHLSVPGALKQLHTNGYNVVILTNQGRISLQTNPKTPKADQRSLTMFKTKVDSILSHFDFPVNLLAATARDVYRKPRIGMWKELLDDLDLDEGEGADLEDSFFVGDAGGRAATANTKADHSCSDRDVATNIGIRFLTPEEYFLKERPRPFTREFEPRDYMMEASTSTDTIPIVFEKKNKLDIVMMCGSPGCGKSTFYWTKLKPLGYGRVNQDILKTRDKCVKVASELLRSEVPVAVDNTNADPDTRSAWVNLANQNGIPIRCAYFTAPVKLCEHNDTVRALGGDNFNPEKRTILPHSAFHSFKARFKEPQIKEGFQDIIKVDFQYQENDESKRIWSQYWI